RPGPWESLRLQPNRLVGGVAEYGVGRLHGRRRGRDLRPSLVVHLAILIADDVVDSPGVGKLRVIAFRARIWRPATRNAGLDGLRIHDLRHTAVALWIAAGANPKEVAARAGHTSVSFTLDRYGHLYPDADQVLRDRLDARHALSQARRS